MHLPLPSLINMSKAGGNGMDSENPCKFIGCKVGGLLDCAGPLLDIVSVAGVKRTRLELATTFLEVALVLLGGIICKQMEKRGELFKYNHFL